MRVSTGAVGPRPAAGRGRTGAGWGCAARTVGVGLVQHVWQPPAPGRDSAGGEEVRRHRQSGAGRITRTTAAAHRHCQ
ncbi:hypothetical protein KPATCC21470_0266 [Kitasatospora purpeofusca]